MPYYVTVEADGVMVVRRQSFDDYGDAIALTSSFYVSRSRRSVLEFTTEVINGRFARSYANLTVPESVDKNAPLFESRYSLAAKQSNAFVYERTYFFLIESAIGKSDADDDLDQE